MLVGPNDGSIHLGMLVPPQMILLPPWGCWYPKRMLLHPQGWCYCCPQCWYFPKRLQFPWKCWCPTLGMLVCSQGCAAHPGQYYIPQGCCYSHPGTHFPPRDAVLLSAGKFPSYLECGIQPCRRKEGVGLSSGFYLIFLDPMVCEALESAKGAGFAPPPPFFFFFSLPLCREEAPRIPC